MKVYHKKESAIGFLQVFFHMALFASLSLYSLAVHAIPEKGGEGEKDDRKARPSVSTRVSFPRIAAQEQEEIELPNPDHEKGRQSARASKPKRRSPKLKIQEPIRYPLGVGFSFWAFWMSTKTEFLRPDQRIPPIMELSFGVKWGIFELDFFVAMAMKKMLEPSGTMFGVGAKAGVYSVQLPWFRLFHAFSFGVIADFSFKRNNDVDVSPYPMLGARAHLGYLQFQPFERLWIEVCPLTLGFPSILEINLGLRYEL